MANHNVISFEQSAESARSRLAGEKHRRAVAAMREHLQQTLPPLIRGLFDRLDDEFYALADRSSSDLLQTRYFEAMRALRKHRAAIEQRFLDGRMAAFDRFWKSAPPQGDAEPERTPELDGDALSLVDEDTLEEELAIDSAVSKAENCYHRTLFALHKRFAAIHRVETFDAEANPVGPRALARGFAEALAEWQSETDVRLIVYKQFDRHVMAYVGALYDELNDILISHDVLPKISQRVRRNPVAPAVQRTRDSQGEAEREAGEVGGAEGVPFDPAMLDMLGRLLEQRRAERPDADLPWYARAAATPQLPQVSTGELVNALGEVQRASMNTAPPDLASLRELQAELMQSLGRELEAGSPERPLKRLDDGDRSMLDVMELLFDFILGDDNLPEPMKALLGRLQIPLLKVGLQDRRFFSDARHPARRLLNNLARAGLAWTDDGDRSADSAYGRIESAVMRILSDFDQDIAIFEQVNEAFESWLEREQSHARVAEQRLTQAREGQEHLQRARLRVTEEIRALLDECKAPECRVPPVVRELLDRAWRDVMLLALLREGEDSDAWKRACDLARELVWSVQPKHEPAERQRLLKRIPDLLSGLRESLNNISFDQHRAAGMFKELQACHIAALRGTWSESTETAGEEAQQDEEATNGGADTAGEALEVTEEIVLETAEETGEVERDAFHEQAEAMEPGTWIEWRDPEGHELRGKLSWRSQLTGNLVFVDRRGMKVAEMTTPGLAALLRGGNARLLEDVDTPLMDRALNAMLDVLKRTDPAQRVH